MIDIAIHENYTELILPELLKATASQALQLAKYAGEVELTVVIDDDEMLRGLNKQFLGIDSPTDVLSFPADEVDPDTGINYLGDIIISYPRAKSQADQAGHPVEAEIQLLVIHGILHLLGYDHSTDEEKQEMWAIQGELIRSMAVNIKKLPED
jgi:probable rRNA maturation factor